MTARATFLGVPVDPIDMAETVDRIERAIAEGRPGVHLGVNAANLIAARDDAAYLRDLAAADLITADGQSVVWGARLRGLAIPERVTGIDLMEALLAVAQERDWSVYLLGARASVVDALARRLSDRGVRVAGYRDGYFDADAGAAVAEVVAASGAQLLFVGTPSPQKEQFAIHHARPAGVPFTIGVGGSFDVLAGEIRRAPRILQRAGLEWFFRLAQEPRRLLRRYAVTNSRFAWLLATDALRARRRT